LVTAPNRHFLDVIGHRSEDHEEPDQVIFVFGAGRRIGGDAARVVVGDHHHDARPGEHEIEADRLEPAPQPVIEEGDPTHSLSPPPAAVKLGATRNGLSDDSRGSSRRRKALLVRFTRLAIGIWQTVLF
jgi:hypothetical protein